MSANGSKKRPPKLDPQTAQIVIVGSGLAGLSAAIALTQAGFHQVSVFERDPSMEYQKEGYGLTLTYNPKGPLAALGVLEQVARQDCPSRSHYLFRASDGLPLGYFGNAFFPEPEDEGQPRRGHGQRGNLRVPRKVLRKILHDKFIEETTRVSQTSGAPPIHWGHKLQEMCWDASTRQYKLKFQNMTEAQPLSVTADLLVAADGIRSTVLQTLYIRYHQRSNLSTTPPSIQESPQWYGLRSMGIRLILGIAEFDSDSDLQNNPHHPLQLLKERGFYTLDGQGRRLFTMPYQSNRFAADPSKVNNRIMWQLSFATSDDDNDDVQSNPLEAASLRQHVLDTCQSWHEPVMDLIRATPLTSIWGTDLMDRDPKHVYETIVCGRGDSSNPQFPRLAVIGDALHSMSPFKGQGANQALADGPLLAQWLKKSSVDAAVSGWWRETLNRTAPIVASSRTAARQLHSCGVTLDEGENCNGSSTIMSTSLHGFAGVKPETIPNLVEILRKRKLGAHLGKKLDDAVFQVIAENNWFHDKYKDHTCDSKQYQDWQDQALHFAKGGQTEGLRQMSVDVAKLSSIISARDNEQRTCLHLAVLNSHLSTSMWLLTELQCCVDAKDSHGKTAYDYCIQSDKNSQLAHIFQCLQIEEGTK
jgi:2-polyprenyl-6-methoxyphenol hydroxylase-like FAD-dependent oxidoreductase